MYDVIKSQWNDGCYSKASDLDIYVQAGWITKDQEAEITGVKKAEAPVAQPSMTTGTTTDTVK